MYFDYKVASRSSSMTINFIDNQKLNAGDQPANGTTGSLNQDLILIKK